MKQVTKSMALERFSEFVNHFGSRIYRSINKLPRNFDPSRSKRALEHCHFARHDPKANLSGMTARKKAWGLFAPALVAALFSTTAFAQTRPAAVENDACKPGYEGPAKCEDADRPATTTPASTPGVKALDTFIKDKTKIDGLFPVYRDDASGKYYMEVREDQIGQDFIYFSFIQNGSAGGESRQSGTLRDNVVFKFRRTLNRLDILLQDTEYTTGQSGPLTLTQGRNVAQSLLSVEAIVARSSDRQTHLIEVSKLFSRNAFVRLGIGGGDAAASNDDSTIVQVRNYPDNLEVVGEHVLRSASATSARSASEIIRVQHTILPMPKPGFVPRLADPRVGYFTSRKTDLSVIEGLPVADVIHRWRLEKRDPSAAVSPVVKPIVFWIEKSTPLEYRDIIKEAVLSWNRAFLQAGFSGAVEAHIQPDDATWDAGDARYNVIQWNASPIPLYLGYGPSFVNPRTGEVLGADIVLEQASLARSITIDRLFSSRSNSANASMVLTAPSEHHDQPDERASHSPDEETCVIAHEMAISQAYATIAAQIGAGARFANQDALREAIIRQGLRYLVIHEVGHTLGLTHNMMASAAVPLRALSGPGSETVQPSASVMDYPAINVAPVGKQQGMFFPDSVGPYDIWAIQFGYGAQMEDAPRRRAHLSRSIEPSLRFGNDADAVVNPERGIDPRVNTFDLSDDPIGFSQQQITLAWQTMPSIIGRLTQAGDTPEEGVAALRLLLSIIERAGVSASRHIGGVYVERTVKGAPTSQPFPHMPIPLADQKRAMDLLARRLFAPDAFTFPPALLSSMQRYRRGFDLASGLTRQDIVIHALVRTVQATSLMNLLHDRTLRRISDTSLYGNEYSVFAFMRDLTNAIFAADMNSEVNGFRRNLQVEYVRQVSTQFQSKRLDAQSEAALLASLERIKSIMQSQSQVGSSANQAHRRYVLRLVNDTLDPRMRPSA